MDLWTTFGTSIFSLVFWSTLRQQLYCKRLRAHLSHLRLLGYAMGSWVAYPEKKCIYSVPFTVTFTNTPIAMKWTRNRLRQTITTPSWCFCQPLSFLSDFNFILSTKHSRICMSEVNFLIVSMWPNNERWGPFTLPMTLELKWRQIC